MSTPKGRKHKGGAIVRFEPQNLTFINVDPTIRVAFEQVGCIRFCEKIQGYNAQLTKEFVMSFDGLEAKVGALTFPVIEVKIAIAMEIPLQGEQWFKGMPLDIAHYKDFLELEYRDKEHGAIVPKEYLPEHHSKLLQAIQRYFTCEGRFGRICQYHFTPLMHFTRKSPLNLPFYLLRSLNKMANKVQGKQSQVEPNLSHFSLTKLLVLEELNKRKQSW